MRIQCLDLILARTIKPIHSIYIFKRRVNILAQHLSNLLPDAHLKGLDVGCGNGEIASRIMLLKPKIKIDGVDVLMRAGNALSQVIQFDGKRLPFQDKSYDFILLVDVLHHTLDSMSLLEECARVGRQFIFIKDHYSENPWDRLRLRFMDWVGNRGYNVALPYQYLSRKQWQSMFETVGVFPEATRTELHCYPSPFFYLFNDQLHFITRLGIDHRGHSSNAIGGR